MADVHVRDVVLRRAHAMNACNVHNAPDGGDVGARRFAGFERCGVGIAGGALGFGERWEVGRKQG